MALAAVKTFVPAEVLFASDLNALNTNILSNALALISPLTGALDADGNDVTNLDELLFSNAGAVASSAGRLRRNAGALTWKDAAADVHQIGTNWGLGTSTFGTDADNTFAFFNGTAPTTSPADTVQVYAADIAAGHAALHLRDEDGIVQIFGYGGHYFTETSDPATPAANKIVLYAKDDSSTTRLYTKNDAGTVQLVGSGGVAYIRLPIEQATYPDSSDTINNPPEPTREVSSGTQTANSPKVTQTFAKFDADTDEHLMWTFIIPSDYGSGGTLRFNAKAATANSGAAYIKGSIAVSTDASTDDDAIVFNTVTGASWAAPATQGHTLNGTVTLTTTNMSANRKATVFIGRDADGTLGTDDMTGDWILTSLTFEYNKA